MLVSRWCGTLGSSRHCGWRSFFAARLPEVCTPASTPRFCDRATIDLLIQASRDSPGSGSTLNQRVTRTRGAAILPIDAQPPGTDGFGRAAGLNDREDFRQSSIGRTRSGLREPPGPLDESQSGGRRGVPASTGSARRRSTVGRLSLAGWTCPRPSASSSLRTRTPS